MSINKSIFPFLLFGMLLQSCGSDVPESNSKSDIEVSTQIASGELADAKLDAVIDSATPIELEIEEAKIEAARKLKADEATAKKIAADEARAEKDKIRKEKAEKASKKRRAKRKVDKLAAEKAAKEKTTNVKAVSAPVENATPAPIEYSHSTKSSSSASVDKNAAPVISFYKTVHKYGTIEQGDKIEYKFKFKNVGKSELVVMDATASCGCTKPSYPFIPIGPGEEGYIGVIFDTKGKLGRQKPSVVITTNADPAQYTIYLEGYVDSADEKEEVSNEENKKEGKDGKSN